MKNPNKVDLTKLHRRARQALAYIDLLFFKFGMEFAIYHTYDGMHMEGSLHFKNRAFDGSLPTSHNEEVFSTLRAAMGPEYDLVVEKDHLHLEWDPK